MSLITEFRAAHRYQQRFVFSAIPLRMDIPGHGSVTEVIETNKLEEAFPLWWEKRHDGLSVDVELITDAQVRETVRVCVNILDDAPEIAKATDQLDVQELVARASHTGFRTLGAWLREEAAPENLQRQAAELQGIGDALWSSAG